MQYPSIGSTRNKSFNNRVVTANEPAEALIGRKVWTKWPDDNSFYEAVVTQYNADEVTSDRWDLHIEIESEYQKTSSHVFNGIYVCVSRCLLYFKRHNPQISKLISN